MVKECDALINWLNDTMFICHQQKPLFFISLCRIALHLCINQRPHDGLHMKTNIYT